jgi:adenylate cyclase
VVSVEAREHTFLFADLAGFTALTEAHGDEESADLAGEFFAAVRDLLGEHGAEEIKTIGDAVMLRAASAGNAVRLGLAIVSEVGAQHGFPGIRVGMHTGPATERSGDWFGATVNIAARVSGAAGSGEVLVTDATRAAGDGEHIDFHERGRREFKNVAEPLLIYAAVVKGGGNPTELPTDPVCRMAVEPARCAGYLIHEGIEYHFCSLRCAQAFAAAPERHARSDA